MPRVSRGRRRTRFASTSEPERARICGRPSVVSSGESSSNDSTSFTNSSCALGFPSSFGSSLIALSSFAPLRRSRVVLLELLELRFRIGHCVRRVLKPARAAAVAAVASL